MILIGTGLLIQHYIWEERVKEMHGVIIGKVEGRGSPDPFGYPSYLYTIKTDEGPIYEYDSASNRFEVNDRVIIRINMIYDTVFQMMFENPEQKPRISFLQRVRERAFQIKVGNLRLLRFV